MSYSLKGAEYEAEEEEEEGEENGDAKLQR